MRAEPDRYAVYFGSDDEELWFTLRRWYFGKEWAGIAFKDDVRHASESLEEFRLKLGVCGLSLGRRLTFVERRSDLVRHFERCADRGGLKYRNFSAKVYELRQSAD